MVLPYSRKIWRFGGLYYMYNRQIKIRQNFLLAYIRMAIPYRTAKFKSANILPIAILGSTAKFNSRQYFRLYGIHISPGIYYNYQIKIRQNFLLAHIRMAIPYQATKFKSTNILAIAILGSTAKFNSANIFSYMVLQLLKDSLSVSNVLFGVDVCR